MPVNVNNQFYYSTKEVAEKFNVSHETVRIWRNKMNLQCVKLGPKKFIYSEKDLEQFLQGR